MNINVTIDNPIGYTNEITLHNIVKQGTIIRPILCIVETGKEVKFWKGIVLHMDLK